MTFNGFVQGRLVSLNTFELIISTVGDISHAVEPGITPWSVPGFGFTGTP